MSKQMNRPQLRFPEFEGEWEKKKLGDVILSIESGTSVNSIDQPILNKLQYGILKTSCISKGEFFPNENKTIIVSEISRATLNPLKDSILVSRMNTPQLVGENGYIDKDYPNLFTPDRLWLLKTFPNYSARFLNYILTTSKIRTIISNIATGTSNSMKNISQPNFLSIESYFPIKPEQTKIASFLTAVDEKIQALKKKHSLLEQYKKGVMQKLFSQELRFKDENGNDFPEWEEKQVKDLFKVTRGDVLAMSLVSDEIENDHIYPVYSSQTKNRGLAGYYNEYLFEDAITWTTDGAGAGDVNFREGKFYCTNVCGVLLSDEGYANLFIAELLNSVSRKYVSYVGNPKLMNNVMAEISIIIPVSVIEQQKISNFLKSLNVRIKQLEIEISKIENWKKGMLQKMFC